MPTGVYKRKPIIKRGDKYNFLTAVRFSHRDKRSQLYWLFKCDCGNKKVIVVEDVKKGSIKSCGCMQRELLKERHITHGMSKTREYKTWASMKSRCLNKNNPGYKNYGARGITVCKRWMKFENFYADMGDKPRGMSLDRIDNNGNYKPENCRWATRRQQGNNKRNNRLLTYRGKTMTTAQWARKTDIDRITLHKRIKKGWSTEKVLTVPIKHRL